MSILFIVIVILLVVWKVWLSKPENIGKAGEKRVARKLDWLPKEYITLNELLLPRMEEFEKFMTPDAWRYRNRR